MKVRPNTGMPPFLMRVKKKQQLKNTQNTSISLKVNTKFGE